MLKVGDFMIPTDLKVRILIKFSKTTSCDFNINEKIIFVLQLVKLHDQCRITIKNIGKITFEFHCIEM